MKNKHLSYEERHTIETMLAKGYRISQIATHLKRNLTTISKEIKAHRFSRNTDIKRSVNGNLKELHCSILEKAPYVCNGCEKKRRCKSDLTVYHAARAHNGSEFSDVNSIENDGEISLFFCDPMRSDQKGRIEKNHTMLRDICPKGSSFDDFTQDTIDLIFSHINSVSRASLNGKTPYDIFEFTYGEKITSLLGIKRIPAREVIQSPILLKSIGKKPN